MKQIFEKLIIITSMFLSLFINWILQLFKKALLLKYLLL